MLDQEIKQEIGRLTVIKDRAKTLGRRKVVKRMSSSIMYFRIEKFLNRMEGICLKS